MNIEMMRTVARMMSPEHAVKVVKKLIAEYESSQDEKKFQEFMRACMLIGIKMLDEGADDFEKKMTTFVMNDKPSGDDQVIPEAICPHCFKMHEQRHMSRKAPKIEPGDYSFCPVCFELSMFDHNMKLRIMSADETAHIYRCVGSEIDECRRMVESIDVNKRNFEGQFIFKDMTTKE